MTLSRGYVFATNLKTIEEDSALTEVTEDEVAACKARTETLAAAARNRMEELVGLLGKLDTGTATRMEIDRVASVNAKLDGLKKDIEASKLKTSEKELGYLKSVTRAKTLGVMKAAKEKEVRSVIRAVCASESVDLAFVIDCTGSMASYISAVKDSVKSIVQRVVRTNDKLKLRLAVVGYRDISGGGKRFEILDFVTSLPEFESFIGTLAATGGADAPEDIAGAIQKANKLSWAQASRITFLIADAPCHGTKFHNSNHDDSYPSGTPGIDILRELKCLQAKSANGTMTLNFGRITSHTDTMISVFAEHGITFDVVKLADFSTIAKCITSSVRKSIFKTMTVSGAGKKSLSFAAAPDAASLLGSHGLSSCSDARLKSYRVRFAEARVVNWESRPTEEVKVFRNTPIKSIDDLKTPLYFALLNWKNPTDETMESIMWMRRAKDPFAEGGIRLAYHGQLARLKEDIGDPKNEFVVKTFKHRGKGLNTRKQYLKQMEVSNIAYFLSKQYNNSASRPRNCAAIRFLQVCVVEEEGDGNEETGQRRYCAEEALPPGSFTKYSNNTGYWNDDALDKSLLLFTRFTYDATGGYLMITDLQGVRNGNEYVLTDPAILCEDIMRFGHTNLGDQFMQKCMDSTRALLEENGWA